MINMLFILFLVALWIISIFALGDICEKKKVPDNCLIWFLIVCPIVNTVLVIYFCYKHNDYKDSLKILFSND